MNAPIREDEVHAYADGRLDPARREAVERWLATQSEQRQHIADWRQQAEALHRAYDPILNAPLPARLAELAATPPAPWRWQRAAALGWLTLGTLIGYGGHAALTPSPSPIATLSRQAAIAHVVYTPEVKHPVEVTADQEAHLVAWLSKRLGSPLKAPHLEDAGYHLIGGRLLPGDQEGVAQFMYENAEHTRLTLYVRPKPGGQPSTAFRYARERDLDVFYWVDGAFAYALTGNTGRAQMLALAESVYRQH